MKNVPSVLMEAYPTYWYHNFAQIYRNNELLYDSVTENCIYAQPFAIPRKMRFDRMGCRVDRPGSINARAWLSFYNSTGQAYPKNLLSYGEINLSTTGEKIITINMTLEPALYWICLECNEFTGQWPPAEGPTILSMGVDIGNVLPNVGWVNFEAPDWMWLYNVGAYIPPPDPFPSGAVSMTKNYVLMLRLAQIWE